MLDMPDKASRIKWGKHGIFKGKIYKKSDASFFVESSLHEAKDILRIAKKPVFCVETMQMMTYVESPGYIKLRGWYWWVRRLFHV